MRWIGYFFLGLLGIIILLLFIRIKIEVFFKNQKGWVELRYLWFKYRVNIGDTVVDSIKSEMSQQFQEVKEVVDDNITKTVVEEKVEIKEIPQVITAKPPKTKEKKIKKEKGSKKEKSQMIITETSKPQKKRVKKEKIKKKKEKVTTQEAKKKFDFKEVKRWIRRGKIILKEAKVILIRLTKKIRIQKLESMIEFSLADVMTTGCLIGVAWTIQANVYRFISRYVKKIDRYHFDVKSQFNGNSILFNISCILSFRIADIIIVLLLSFKELLTIKRMLKLEEE